LAELDKHHWLYGIEEYLTRINHLHSDQFTAIKKAILYGKPWPIRDLMLKLVDEGKTESSEEHINLVLTHYLPELEVTSEQILRFINRYVDDGFLIDTHTWISNYQDRADLNDHFSRGQIKSKLWLMEELRNVVSGNELGTVVLYGGWYATIAHFFFKFFSPSRLYSIDLDPTTVEVADSFNKRQGIDNNWQFKAFEYDVNKINYNGKKFSIPSDKDTMGITQLEITPTVIVNTSCEHMNEDWFYNLPDGQFVVLQTNDYFENEQHINCCKDIKEVLNKYKFSEVYFSGELDTQLYNRFMVIGKK
jgi:hypothetical protein|tara:strand:+ start:212 stop:1126 length:915 start_codon:yes stop_codon:yes gene_type:complete